MSLRPGAREPISHSKKKGAMMQKANVSHGKAKMDKRERGRELPCVRRSRSLYRDESSVVRCYYRWNGKKSDEEAKKKRREGFVEEGSHCSKCGV
jgi:hypothetical protein